MPDTTEVGGFVFSFQDIDDLWMSIYAFDEGVFNRIAKLRGKCEILFRIKSLRAKEDDKVIMKSLADIAYGG